MKHVERFLEEGSKVKLTIMFRGREMAHPELGRRILERVAEQVGELAIIESAPKQDGRNMTMVLNPTRRPKGKGQGATKGAPKSGGGAGDAASRTRSRPTQPEPPTEVTADSRPDAKTRTHHAQDEDAPRRGQALQDDRAPARSGAARRTATTCSRRSPSRRTRRLGRVAEVTGGDSKRVKRLLGK